MTIVPLRSLTEAGSALHQSAWGRIFILLGVLLGFSIKSVAMGIPVIAAASDLQFALEDIARQFTAETGLSVKLSFGSSGNFFRQISQGAPYEMYLSADEENVFDLRKQGLALDDGRLYALGRLVFFVPKGSPIAPDPEFKSLKESLISGRLKQLAIANPDHAPYGRAARETLIAAGLWDDLKNRLVLGENVSQAAQFAVSGSAQGGIFAYSLALSPKIKSMGDFVLLPESLHKPLRQRMVLLKSAGATAKAFYRYLQQAGARAILARYGFTLP